MKLPLRVLLLPNSKRRVSRQSRKIHNLAASIIASTTRRPHLRIEQAPIQTRRECLCVISPNRPQTPHDRRRTREEECWDESHGLVAGRDFLLAGLARQESNVRRAGEFQPEDIAGVEPTRS